MSFGGFPLGTAGYSSYTPSPSRDRDRDRPLRPTNDRLSSLFRGSSSQTSLNNNVREDQSSVETGLSPRLLRIDTSGLEDIVLPVTRSRRRSSLAGSSVENSGDDNRQLSGLGPRRGSDGNDRMGERLGLGISRITEHDDEDDPSGLAAAPNQTDAFAEYKLEQSNLKGVDPSILPTIHLSLSALLSSHRLRIQTLQSTIQHRVEEFDTVRYRMTGFDREAEGMWRGMMGEEEEDGQVEAEAENVEGEEKVGLDSTGGQSHSEVSREGGSSSTLPKQQDPPSKSERFLDVNHRSQPHRPSPLSLSTRPSSTETILESLSSDHIQSNNPSSSTLPTQSNQPPSPPRPPPLKSLLTTLEKTSAHLTATEIELSARAQTLKEVREAIERLPDVERELIRRIEGRKIDFEVISRRKKRNERNIMIAWVVGMTSLIVAITAWLLRCEKRVLSL